MLSDAEALEAVAREALAGQTQDVDRGDARHMVVLYECTTCRRTEIETGAGAVELDPAAAERLACGAPRCDLATEGRTVTRGGVVPAPVRRAVLLRDRMRCRAPGCTRRRFVDVHHAEAREHGGVHSRRNCVTLCTSCHERVHDGRLRVDGGAERELVFRDVRGEPIGVSTATRGGRDGAPRATPDASSPAAASLLTTMGARGGWHPDHLVDATGLGIAEVLGALLELELGGRVRGGVGGYQAG